MHVGRFHAALECIKREYESKNILALLQQLQAALQQSVSQPTTETAKEFKIQYSKLTTLLSSSDINTTTGTRKMIFENIGASKHLGDGLLVKIKRLISANQIVPANALSELNVLIQEITTFLTSINNIINEFESLEIEYEELNPGEFEGGISIPRSAISSNLEDLSKEFLNIDTFVKTVKEIVGDESTSASVKTITSTEWQIFIEYIPEAAACAALAVERIVALYKNHLEIRKLKMDMDERNLPESVTKPMQDYIDSIVKEKLREIGEEVVDTCYKSDDEGRKNELKTKLTRSLRYVAKRIDHGATFETDASIPDKPTPEEGSEENDEASLEKYNKLKELAEYVIQTKKEISRLERSEQPMLMLTEEVDGDEKDNNK